MHSDVKVAWIKTLPAYIGLALLFIFLTLNWTGVSNLLGKISGIGIGGVSLNFSYSDIPKELRAEVDGFTPGTALNARYGRLQKSIVRMRMIVLHDKRHVANWLAAIFRDMGATVDVAICAEEASLLLSHHYDVILSDINWKDCNSGPKNAIEFLNQVNLQGVRAVFYISNLKGNKKEIPLYAQELANTFEGMLNGVFDVVSRSNRLAN